jgi:hypothetical protein
MPVKPTHDPLENLLFISLPQYVMPEMFKARIIFASVSLSV